MSDDFEDDDIEIPGVPKFFDNAAQRAQAAQYLLVASDNLTDPKGKELAHSFVDALIRSIDPKAQAIKVVK